MKTRQCVLLALVGLFVVSSQALASTPVIVELFESQGCSSCPPSERVMDKLRQEFGSGVILLTYHVDYWDYLGWKDSFSSPRWTEHQKEYGRLFNQSSIYTPEMVIQGQVGFVGSDQRQARTEVRASMNTVADELRLSATKENDSLIIVAALPKELATGGKQLTAVVVENASPVHVLAGENRGETMTGNYAVRAVVDLQLAGDRSQARASLKADKSWNLSQTTIAVIVRDPSLKVLSAGSLPWPQN